MTDNTETQEALAEALDKYLLKRLKKSDAEPQIFEIARKRLKDLNLSREDEGDNSAAARFAAELEKHPETMESHGVPGYIPEVVEEPETAVG